MTEVEKKWRDLIGTIETVDSLDKIKIKPFNAEEFERLAEAVGETYSFEDVEDRQTRD